MLDQTNISHTARVSTRLSAGALCQKTGGVFKELRFKPMNTGYLTLPRLSA